MAKAGVDVQLDYLPRLPRRRDVPIGCVGAGFIMSDCHLVAYRQAGFRPVAITSEHPEKALAVAEQHGLTAYEDIDGMLASGDVEVVDIAVPPDQQLVAVKQVLRHKDRVRGILAQKPLGIDLAQAKEIVAACKRAGVTLAVNQNMRYDQSIRALKCVLDRGYLGDPVLATLDLRAIPHWMPWQERLGWLTLRILSIHHLDTFRYLFGEPERVYCSTRSDPRTAKQFAHTDGIALYILEYENGLRVMSCDDVWTGPTREGAAGDIGIRWRVEGTSGLARGTIGWPEYPARVPSTLDFSTTRQPNCWFQPRWSETWFPDAFVGPMAQLLVALETNTEPEISGQDILRTMALVEACYRSSEERRVVAMSEFRLR